MLFAIAPISESPMKLSPISRASFRLTLCGLLLLGAVAWAGESGESVPLKQGDAITIDGHRAVLTTLDTLPYVDDQYTRRSPAKPE